MSGDAASVTLPESDVCSEGAGFAETWLLVS
jgi:hypothetical protein